MSTGCFAACPNVPPGERDEERTSLAVTVSVPADAVEPDPGDAPPLDGALPIAPDSVKVLDVGILAVDGGRTADILVEARGLGAMQVLVWGHPGATVVLERALDPDGAAVVNDEEVDGLSAQELAYARGFPAQVFSLNRVFGSAQSGAFLLPNTPSVPAVDGTWVLRVGQYVVDLDARPPAKTPLDRPVRVVILARGVDGGAGHVNLHVHSAVPGSEFLVAGAVDVVRDVWGQAGISVGEVRFAALDPAHAVVELVPGRCESGALDELLRSGATEGFGLDVFVIERFVCVLDGGVDLGSSLGGIAGGIPGPAWVHGSSHAGVAVATASAAGDAATLGTVLVHELGHFLGLFHTKEATIGGRPIVDEIPDSPDGDDADENLMYYAPKVDLSLSEGQARVLRSSPFVLSDAP